MDKNEIASSVLQALGGRENVRTNTVCMTRLRVTLNDFSNVDFDKLGEVQGVLGTALRGQNGLEVVFGPRLIDGIYRSFLKLTNIEAGTDALFPMTRQDSNMRVQVNCSCSSKDGKSAADKPEQQSQHPASSTKSASYSRMDDRDMQVLRDFLDKKESDTSSSSERRLLILNGPNVNLIGYGDPELQSGEGYANLLKLCIQTSREAGFDRCDCLQSNHEGDLVDAIQDAYCLYDGIIINAGPLSKTSRSIADALQITGTPTIEVRLGSSEQLGTSILENVCVDVVTSTEKEVYVVAIRRLAAHLS